MQAFVSHLLGAGTAPPTEQEPGSVSVVFSRPPGRKTKMRLVEGMKELRISEKRGSPAMPVSNGDVADLNAWEIMIRDQKLGSVSSY